MTESISNVEAHEIWSENQLAEFQRMSARERLNAVKTGALEHWTETARATGLDLLGENGSKATNPPTSRTHHFEQARHPLPPQLVRPPRIDWFVFAASIGWTAIVIATAARAYGFY